MQNKSIRKMKRKDLLEVLLLQNQKIEELEEELNKEKEKQIIISESGSIAEISLKLNNIFEIAQKTADDYLQSIKKIHKNTNTKNAKEYNKKVVVKIENNKETNKHEKK